MRGCLDGEKNFGALELLMKIIFFLGKKFMKRVRFWAVFRKGTRE